MNLFLTRGCNERCAFCYAGDFFAQAPGTDEEALFTALDRYARLVSEAPPLPPWSDDVPELAMTLYASRSVGLLGGEPTLHPLFERVVNAIADHGLGVVLFTNGSRPDRVAAVADRLWSVTINGHFAHRAPTLGFDVRRIFANLPLMPGDDVEALLTGIRDAGIRGMFLAFATPVGGADPGCFTPDDQEAMRAMHARALTFCEDNGIYLGYDCSFPLCVDERVRQTKCTSVPVMNTSGQITICGGEYAYQDGLRPIESFASLDELHAYTYGLIGGLRALPSRYDVCNRCPEFNKRCHGMCLAYRDRDQTRGTGISTPSVSAHSASQRPTIAGRSRPGIENPRSPS